ncbi:putative solute carrier family 13 member 5 [Apostichopus japonicus]|uniref:Putative solute carrier family 13 member 5 n=1 Tax=Stichopus japonicus TaxID=307972 RepID=A0A2G8LKI4_STIJA|nr:putative solute carrier family 13 member 5 [Apostichopus japonicus]
MDSRAQYRRMCKGITLAIPYAANIGGTATVTGTGPNLVLINQIDSLYGSEANVSFGTWMMVAFPCMIICLFICWLWLQFLFLDSFKFWKKTIAQTDEQKERARSVIRNQYSDLGPMSFAEKAVLVHFVILIALWLTRDPKFVNGWSVIFEEGFVTDSTTVIAVCMVLFCFPSQPLGFMCRPVKHDEPKTREEKREHKISKTIPTLLSWRAVEQKMAWGVIFLLGGGAAMAEACKASGLSSWLGEALAVFGNLSPGIMALLISFIVAAFTEITSNTATATIFLPIFAELAVGLGVNPLYIMIPSTLACSYAFMLPVATPPNAIAFSHGTLTVMDMASTGLMLNILCVLVANFTINTFGVWIFDVKTFPAWAADDMTTIAPTSAAINCSEYIKDLYNVGTTVM